MIYFRQEAISHIPSSHSVSMVPVCLEQKKAKSVDIVEIGILLMLNWTLIICQAQTTPPFRGIIEYHIEQMQPDKCWGHVAAPFNPLTLMHVSFYYLIKWVHLLEYYVSETLRSFTGILSVKNVLFCTERLANRWHFEYVFDTFVCVDMYIGVSVTVSMRCENSETEYFLS